jgi:hypothetical protein
MQMNRGAAGQENRGEKPAGRGLSGVDSLGKLR